MNYFKIASPIFLSIASMSITFASNQTNIDIVKNMFTEFAEKKDINKLDTYYTKDFILESNNEKFDYQAYKNLEASINKKIKTLKVIYQDIFSDSDKVSARIKINIQYLDGTSTHFNAMLIAQIINNKIAKIWELTYPSWNTNNSKKMTADTRLGQEEQRAALGFTFNHVGYPTTQKLPNETCYSNLDICATATEASLYGVQWVRFLDHRYPTILETLPHIGFKVNDLNDAIKNKKVLYGPYEPSPGLKVVFIEDNKVPIELMQFEKK